VTFIHSFIKVGYFQDVNEDSAVLMCVVLTTRPRVRHSVKFFSSSNAAL